MNFGVFITGKQEDCVSVLCKTVMHPKTNILGGISVTVDSYDREGKHVIPAMVAIKHAKVMIKRQSQAEQGTPRVPDHFI